MYQWRVTKYNPMFRDESGAFKKDEWTSISDIGRTFNGVVLTLNKYLKVEDLYVKTISEFMDSLKISTLSVINIEKPEKPKLNPHFKSIYTPEMIKLFDFTKEGTKLEIGELMMISRLALRENLCCKLWGKYKMFVHFGYDYYMYIGSSSQNQSVIQKIKDSGLFIEEFISPYR